MIAAGSTPKGSEHPGRSPPYSPCSAITAASVRATPLPGGAGPTKHTRTVVSPSESTSTASRPLDHCYTRAQTVERQLRPNGTESTTRGPTSRGPETTRSTGAAVRSTGDNLRLRFTTPCKRLCWGAVWHPRAIGCVPFDGTRAACCLLLLVYFWRLKAPAPVGLMAAVRPKRVWCAFRGSAVGITTVTAGRTCHGSLVEPTRSVRGCVRRVSLCIQHSEGSMVVLACHVRTSFRIDFSGFGLCPPAHHLLPRPALNNRV